MVRTFYKRAFVRSFVINSFKIRNVSFSNTASTVTTTIQYCTNEHAVFYCFTVRDTGIAMTTAHI